MAIVREARMLGITTILVATAGCACLKHSAGERDMKGETLVQISTIDALMAGNYRTGLPLSDLLAEADFGLGTVDRLDGELVILEGALYQVQVSGKVRRIDASTLSPFAAATAFEPDDTFAVEDVSSLNDLQHMIAERIEPQYFHAVRIDGTFLSIRTRSVPPQSSPRPLVDVVKEQATFDFENVEGTIVGLYCPEFIHGFNVPGFHFHFLTRDRTAGGHVLAMEVSNAEVMVDQTPGLKLMLPKDFSPGTSDAEGLERVEKQVK